MQRVLIVGAGFAGMYAALCAARLRDGQGVSPDTLEIVVVARRSDLVAVSATRQSGPLYRRAAITFDVEIGTSSAGAVG